MERPNQYLQPSSSEIFFFFPLIISLFAKMLKKKIMSTIC